VSVLARIARVIVLTCLACWLVYVCSGRPKRGIDDAQITFSYSVNLAAGHGLTYAHNPERVEGFTSLLWTLICAAPFRLGLNEPGVLAITLLVLCLTQILILEVIRKSASVRRLPTWPFELAYLLPVFSCPMYFTWMSITLMDTCLWGLGVVLMSYVALFPPRSHLGVVVASMPFFFAPLSRPEAAFVAPAIIALMWLRGRSNPQHHPHLTLGLTAAFLTSAVAVTLFRLWFFGYPLPNTYYAKISPSLIYSFLHGSRYALDFASAGGPVVGVSLIFLLWFAGNLIGRLARGLRMRPRRPVQLADWELAALIVLILLVIPVLTGGDHFRGFRFYQPAFPLMALTVALFLTAWCPANVATQLRSLFPLKHNPFAFSFLLAGLGFWAVIGAHAPSWRDFGSKKGTLASEFEIAEYGVKKGENLGRLLSGSACLPTIGVIAAGGIARTYPGRIVDLMGLNSTAIAHYPGDRKGLKNHAAFEKEAFFRLVRIDILWTTLPTPPDTSNFATIALKGLLSDPRFVKEWRYGVLYSAADTNICDTAFISRTYLEGLDVAAPARFRESMRWANKWVQVADAGSTASPGRVVQ